MQDMDIMEIASQKLKYIFATTLQNKSLVKLKKDYDRNITIIRYYIV